MDVRYKPTWICRLFGHKPWYHPTGGEYINHLDYCRRCFLPTSKWLKDGLDLYREHMNETRAAVTRVSRELQEIKSERVSAKLAPECTCVQDESREWRNCPVHGAKWREHERLTALFTGQERRA